MKPICEIDSLGTKKWHLNGLVHREDGPAIIWYNGDKSWYLNGVRHREDGPAFEFCDGSKKWYYHGNRIHCKNNQEFLRMIKLMAFL
tara:strand:+ start:1825 stop:2085 length:261 start_codon:yes stop_codon:yes gene_type:complete